MLALGLFIQNILLRTHGPVYDEIGNIIAEIYQPERKENVTKS